MVSLKDGARQGSTYYLFRSSTGRLRECRSNHVVESDSKGESRVQEGQKFYGYKHPLKH